MAGGDKTMAEEKEMVSMSAIESRQLAAILGSKIRGKGISIPVLTVMMREAGIDMDKRSVQKMGSDL